MIFCRWACFSFIQASNSRALQVSVLDAYKRLHDSKKRGQQSLAEVPMEHLAKARKTVADFELLGWV